MVQIWDNDKFSADDFLGLSFLLNRFCTSNSDTSDVYYGSVWRTEKCTLAVVTSAKNLYSTRSFFGPSVCLSVCQQLHVKTTDRIFMKILPEMHLWTRMYLLNFGLWPAN